MSVVGYRWQLAEQPTPRRHAVTRPKRPAISAWGNELKSIVPPAENRIANHCKITRKVEVKGLEPATTSLRS